MADGGILSRPDLETLRALPTPLRCPDSELLKEAIVGKLPAFFLSFSGEKEEGLGTKLLPLKTSGMA